MGTVAQDWLRWSARLTRLEPHHENADAAYTAEVEALPFGAKLLHRSDDAYPSRLLELKTPPEFVYWQGRELYGRTVGMVGTRHPDPEGVRLAENLASEVARAGATIISGGAIGIDSACHRQAVEMGRPTVVVLPASLDQVTPARNRQLFDDVLNTGGAIVSEYPLGTPLRKHFFARRNSLIAALSDDLWVIRARATGGTHLTVAAARELQRKIWVVPGSPEDASSEGCLELLRDGCHVAWRAEHLGLQLARESKGVCRHPEILKIVANCPGITMDELACMLGRSIQALAFGVIELEADGHVVREGPCLRARGD
ncbi:MAG: DNA-processing protein DprA [bacterium]